MGQTDFLFSMPNFVTGMASVMDINSNLVVYNESNSGEKADAKALYMDWKAVGDMIREAVKAYERK